MGRASTEHVNIFLRQYTVSVKDYWRGIVIRCNTRKPSVGWPSVPVSIGFKFGGMTTFSPSVQYLFPVSFHFNVWTYIFWISLYVWIAWVVNNIWGQFHANSPVAKIFTDKYWRLQHLFSLVYDTPGLFSEMDCDQGKFMDEGICLYSYCMRWMDT